MYVEVFSHSQRRGEPHAASFFFFRLLTIAGLKCPPPPPLYIHRVTRGVFSRVPCGSIIFPTFQWQ